MKLKHSCLLTLVLILALNAGAAASWPPVQRPQTPGQGQSVTEQPPALYVELVGQIGGPVVAAAALGDYAYVGVGPRLVILDVTDPAGPILVGQTTILPRGVAGVTVAGTLTWPMGALLGLGVGLLAPVGDLGVSMLKRQMGLKDTGQLLPGHGGMFDRIDSWLFAVPLTYFLALLLQH